MRLISRITPLSIDEGGVVMLRRVQQEIPEAYFRLPLAGELCPVFAVNQLVLAEKTVKNGFEYKLVNTSDGQVKNIGHYNNRFSQQEMEQISNRMRESIVSGQCKAHPEERYKLLNILDELFAILAKEEPHNQNDLYNFYHTAAKQAVDTLTQRGVYFVDVSIDFRFITIYILAALLARANGLNSFWLRNLYPYTREFGHDTPMPVVIVTSSSEQQNTLSNEILPALSKLLSQQKLIDLPLTSVIRKRKEHYICDLKLHRYLNSSNMLNQTALTALQRRTWEHIDLDGLSIPAVVKKKICVDNNCTAACTYHGQCRYMRYLDYINSSEHDCQICDHHTFLVDAAQRKRGKRGVLPNYQAAIIHEVDLLPKVARSFFGIHLSNHVFAGMRDQLEMLPVFDKYQRTSMLVHMDNLIRLSKRFFRCLFKTLPPIASPEQSNRVKVRLNHSAMCWCRDMSYNIKELLKLLSMEDQHNTTTARQLTKMQANIQSLVTPQLMTCWLETPGGHNLSYDDTQEYVFRAVPRELGDLLYDSLWQKRLPYILINESKENGTDNHLRIKREIGWARLDEGRARDFIDSA